MIILYRLLFLCVLVGHIVNFIVTPYASPAAFEIKDWLLYVWTGIYLISIFLFWGLMFYHWGVSEFQDKSVKKKWFLAILIGGFLYLIGPLIYYFIVVEKGRGLKQTGST